MVTIVTGTNQRKIRAGAVAAILLASGSLWMTEARGNDTGYTFSNASVQQVDERQAKIVYDYAWATQEFPGWRVCTWRVYGPDGSTIGETTNALIGLDDQYAAKEKVISVNGVATSAGITCEDDRLDSAGDYGVSEVRATRRGTDPRSVTVVFAAAWNGSGRPGAASCTAVVKDREGNILTTQDFDLLVASPQQRDLSHSWLAPEPLSERPATAELDCGPLGR